MLLSQLLRAPAGSRLVRSKFDGTTLTLCIATTKPNASCPYVMKPRPLAVWPEELRAIRRASHRQKA